MTKIKICGLKREEDIQYVNELLPDYVGFVFAKSPRQVNADRARELMRSLNKNIKKVGVFLNMEKEEVSHIAESCGLDVLQFHGEETPDYCHSFQQEVWKAFRIKDKNSLKEVEKYVVDGYLLDTYTFGQYGGSGRTFSWELGRLLKKPKLLILAGGLQPNNVVKAIEALEPDVVDVSSGVEEDGAKSFEKMKQFIKNGRGQI